MKKRGMNESELRATLEYLERRAAALNADIDFEISKQNEAKTRIEDLKEELRNVESEVRKIKINSKLKF